MLCSSRPFKRCKKFKSWQSQITGRMGWMGWPWQAGWSKTKTYNLALARRGPRPPCSSVENVTGCRPTGTGGALSLREARKLSISVLQMLWQFKKVAPEFEQRCENLIKVAPECEQYVLMHQEVLRLEDNDELEDTCQERAFILPEVAPAPSPGIVGGLALHQFLGVEDKRAHHHTNESVRANFFNLYYISSELS